jgi:hypothetical protein
MLEPESADLEESRIAGVVVVDNGCFYLDGSIGARAAVVWPHGTYWNAAESRVEREGGLAPFDEPPLLVQLGDYIEGTGGLRAVSQVASLLDNDARGSLDRCTEGDVAVFFADTRVGSAPAWVPPTTHP